MHQDFTTEFSAEKEWERAARIAGEHDSLEQSSTGFNPVRRSVESYHRCAKCGVEVEDDYDRADGYPTRSESLCCCSNAECECAFHPECAQSADGREGLCPCCAVLAREAQIDREERDPDNITESRVGEMISDARATLEDFARDRNTPPSLLRIGHSLHELRDTLAAVEHAYSRALLRQAMHPLPLGAAS